MKKSLQISVHLFFWIVFTAFVFMLSKIYLQAKPEAPMADHLFYVVFIELLMGLIFFYVTYFGIPWFRKKKINLAVLSAILLFLLMFFAYPASRFGVWEVMSSIIPHIIVIFLAVIFRKYFDAIRLEGEKQALMLQNTKSELALLKMQVSPHFLFNTLNNIDYLVTQDAAKASGAISKLGAILRYMIYDAAAEKIALSKELKHIEDYIELVRLRTSGDNYLNYKLSGLAGHLQIAPMLFQPLIENAYKHSSTREGDNIINIDIKIVNRDLHFLINNEYDSSHKSVSPEGGLGLNIVKRRLELIYTDRHNLNITKDNRNFKVELIIELDDY
jgi:two-component system LytT family sensor kinase